jgi:hypothetical protein
MPAMVNGPEGVLEWDAVNWRVHEKNVARLRQRIFTAVRDGDWPQVRNLQKMMLRSWSNTLVSVRCSATRWLGRSASRWVSVTGDGKGPAGGPAGPCGAWVVVVVPGLSWVSRSRG